MSKKLLIIIINFVVVLIVTFLLINKIKVYQGLKDVYVAKEEIRKGQEITLSMLELRKVTLNREGKNAKLVSYYNDVITPSNIKDAIGKYAAYDIIQDEIIVKAKLEEQKQSNANYMHELPKGYYAYVINNTIPGGIVEVNDYIDLYVYSEEMQTVIDEPALRHLRVYDLRDKDGKQVNNTMAPSANPDENVVREVKYIVIALNDFQLKKLMYYENNKGAVKAVVRNRNTEKFDYMDIEYPLYAILSDVDLVDEAREKEILEQIKGRNKANLDNQTNKPANQQDVNNTNGINTGENTEFEEEGQLAQ